MPKQAKIPDYLFARGGTRHLPPHHTDPLSPPIYYALAALSSCCFPSTEQICVWLSSASGFTTLCKVAFKGLQKPVHWNQIHERMIPPPSNRWCHTPVNKPFPFVWTLMSMTIRFLWTIWPPKKTTIFAKKNAKKNAQKGGYYLRKRVGVV